MVPLQFVGLPGGPELLIVGIIFMLMFGVPLAAVVVVGVLWLRSNEDGDSTRERVDELEREVETLREQLDAAVEGDDAVGTRDASGGGSTAGEDAE